jgi:hypothetical protein
MVRERDETRTHSCSFQNQGIRMGMYMLIDDKQMIKKKMKKLAVQKKHRRGMIKVMSSFSVLSIAYSPKDRLHEEINNQKTEIYTPHRYAAEPL